MRRDEHHFSITPLRETQALSTVLSVSYPPQPGQPSGQPNPYGQQGPYGQQPNTGGFQGQQQYGQQQFGQQPYPGGYPQGQFGGYGGPPPPEKKKTGLWVSLGVLVVAVAAFAITAFVAPGFLLSKDDNNQAGSGDAGGTSSQPGPSGRPGTGGQSGSSPQATAQALVTALNAQDTSALNSMTCSDATKSVHSGIDDISAVKHAELGPPGMEASGFYAQIMMVTTSSTPKPYIGTLAKEGGKWCWQNLQSGDQVSIPNMPSLSMPSLPTRTSS